jgi:hypothetical protein
MCNPKEVYDIISELIVAAAAIVGGWWALTRYLRERTDEAAIEMDLQYRTEPVAGEFLTAFDLTMTNKGRVKVQAKIDRKNGMAYEDRVEKLRYSLSLQIKPLPSFAPGRPRHFDWFDATLPSLPGSPLSEINLLTEYEDPEQNNEVHFWMEPNEAYHFGVAVFLPAGHYLVKTTFLGTGGDDNFGAVSGLLACRRSLRHKSY